MSSRSGPGPIQTWLENFFWEKTKALWIPLSLFFWGPDLCLLTPSFKMDKEDLFHTLNLPSLLSIQPINKIPVTYFHTCVHYTFQSEPALFETWDSGWLARHGRYSPAPRFLQHAAIMLPPYAVTSWHLFTYVLTNKQPCCLFLEPLHSLTGRKFLQITRQQRQEAMLGIICLSQD